MTTFSLWLLLVNLQKLLLSTSCHHLLTLPSTNLRQLFFSTTMIRHFLSTVFCDCYRLTFTGKFSVTFAGQFSLSSFRWALSPNFHQMFFSGCCWPNFRWLFFSWSLSANLLPNVVWWLLLENFYQSFIGDCYRLIFVIVLC